VVGLAGGSVALGVAVGAVGIVVVGGVLLGEGSTHSLTRMLSVAELTPFAVALLVIMVVGATPVRTRTWILTTAGSSLRVSRLQRTICAALQLPVVVVTSSNSRFGSRESSKLTVRGVLLVVATQMV
jgi:hypothetical protein